MKEKIKEQNTSLFFYTARETTSGNITSQRIVNIYIQNKKR
ncbi:MAG: hypothetical protein ACE5J0_00920 [Candidatus Paceibacterales bacterium]